jgi:DNA polymerase II large subunit
MSEVVLSDNQQAYFDLLQKGVDDAYEVASACKAMGLDPRTTVEIPQASDMASRVHQLLEFLHDRNTAQQIRELTKKNDGDREQVAIDVSLLVCMESIVGNYSLSEVELKKRFAIERKKKSPIDIANAVYHGICAGLAVITEGILVAPLEGVVSCEIFPNKDGTNCLSVNYAGPIRSAGGTGQAISVLLADYLRREFDLQVPVMESNEVERYIEEVMLYHSLQYKPSADEMRSICQSVPIYITGEGVGKEVSGGRDLNRVPTNRVREGMLLVLCEGMLLKAPKLKKHTDRLGLDGWGFLDSYCQQSNNDDDKKMAEFKPKDKFLADAVAGRPTISQPMGVGGFRLRYGRARGAGLAATAIHPCSMFATGGFITVATQMKIERPGKATVVSPCTTIDGPYVQFIDGSARRVNDIEDMTEQALGGGDLFSSDIVKVWDLGEILIPAGEFRENNHPLMPSPYVHEWHSKVVSKNNIEYPTSFDLALGQSKKYGIPIAPEYSCLFSDLTAQELKQLMENMTFTSFSGSKAIVGEDNIELAYRLCVDIEKNAEGQYLIYGDSASVLLNALKKGKAFNSSLSDMSGLEFINKIVDYKINPRVTYRIGSRMAKPEKVSRREMKPPIHGLIPLGHDIHSRKVKDAVDRITKPLQIGWRYCPECVKQDIKPESIRTQIQEGKGNPKWLTTDVVCKACDKPTDFLFTPSWSDPKDSYPQYPFGELWSEAVKIAGYRTGQLKGVKGMTSKEKIPEHMAKALIRHKNKLSVFRDGTIRFDMCDMTLTHFKPDEADITVEKAIKLGYTHDIEGNALTDGQQILELKVQDYIAPTSLKDEFLNTSRFVDEMLIRLYNQKPYYSCDSGDDLVGHLFATLAPHTSGAILCRLVGFTDIKGGYFHPYSIAGRRRNSDGDIDSVILLMDCLVNFSRTYLSSNRGGQMDAPLILTTRIDPTEIDKEALNVDSSYSYSEEFYKATYKRVQAKDIGDYTEFIEHRLGTEEQFEGIGFTHDTNDISEGPKLNPYTSLANMKEKVSAQFNLGAILVSVDNKDQSSRLLDRHLLRDMRGNIRAFGQQKVRCVKCNHIYRRPPLAKRCNQIEETSFVRTCMGCGHYHSIDSEECEKCGLSLEQKEVCKGKLTLTIYPASVKKYKNLMTELIAKHGCSDYNKQKFDMFVSWLDDLFEAGAKQTSLEGLFDE